MNPLAGIRVLDLGRYIAAPFCSALLADYGADVIRIESPGGGEDREQGPMAPSGDNLRYLMLGRNKRGVSLDITRPRGRQLLMQLVERSDVLVENYSPAVKVRLGLTPDRLHEVNPRLVAVSISAFGTSGPYRDRVAFDPIIQAEAGSMSFNGHPGHPPVRSQVPWVDFGTGLYAAFATMLALWRRDQTGQGQHVDASLNDTAFSFVGFMGAYAEYEALGGLRPQLANRGYHHFCDLFTASDGQVVIAVLSNVIWRRLCDVVARPDLRDDPRLQDDTARYAHHDELRTAIQEWVGPRTVAEVTEAAERGRVPCGRVNSIADALADSTIESRGLVTRLDLSSGAPLSHPHVGVRLAGLPSSIRHRAPSIGEHNADVLGGLLGVTGEALAALESEGIV